MPNNEISMVPDKIIISKTDAKGKILYVNTEFCRISGFDRTELIGEPHSIIRHQDMPRGVFRLLWQTLQSGNEFNGFIKNLCKNKDYYWVFATVSPWFGADGKTLQGYFSARRLANPEGVKFFSDIYKVMLNQESGMSGSEAVNDSMNHLTQLCENRGLSYDQLAIHYQTR